MASYATGNVGGSATTSADDSIDDSAIDSIGERMASLAAASCLRTTPVKYHATRFAIVVGLPLVGTLTLGAAIGPELVAKVVVWFVATEVSGFGGADGQLGDGHTLLTPLWFRLTPGTLRQSPFADPSTPPSGRSRLDALVLISTLFTAVATIGSTGHAHAQALRLFAGAFTALCLRDYSAWCGGQGKHFYPLLLSAAFAGPAGTLAAMQATQFAHIFFSGLCKLGPWWINVVPTMFGMAPCFPEAVRALAFKDARAGDAAPSGASMLLALAGVIAELAGPLLWLAGGVAARLGVLLVGGMHAFIILANPLGGIGEWNAANIFLEWYLFGLHSCAPRAFLAAPPPPLAAFLLASQYFAPVLGNLRPDSMSYLLAPLLDLQRPLTESLIPSSIRCGLDRGDLLSLRISSFPLLPDLATGRYRCHWSVVDAVDALSADPSAPTPELPPGAPARWGLFGRTTASLLWDLAGEKKGVIECDLFSGFFEGRASAWQFGDPAGRRTFDAQGRDITAKKVR
ncbi:hypothetical protein EMIHUDRAFT_109220 [Emiliania huxleyi CCMP1516]|uniref:HTTM domain-containing protein n=2 Tax=Emiliania huxleyi TaxID=2903 RepID=A0A0D3KSR9_EMIH1|nr:hypothetical protein EMIHUDRAFT_109220 [Emiliania huxleyi CCMP1516]EOD38804.1 hypothetical protein EMIHUDRAFT_109220 [Emiliania huxleyi CCMP1516]|eukprot:XP_005791233.1 hypothetical protein EMIHUDRAFT_109220 [Emiliania huxleyi CCMP1516]